MSAPLIGMKTNIFRLIAVFAVSLCFVGCGEGKMFHSQHSQYVLALPQAPEAWVSLLGQPHWKVEWQNSSGQKQIKTIIPGESIVIELPQTWTSAVLAWPYWPEQDIGAGLFRPAGALFPFDSSGDRVSVSWKAGPDAVFYRELVLANGQNGAKIPAYFDWPRFRELFELETLNEAVQKDPWLVDWRFVAEKTVNSSFDRRRLVPESAGSMIIPVFSGPWFGTSPFAEPLFFTENETPVFQVRPGINVWISGKGILRYSGKTWIFTEWK